MIAAKTILKRFLKYNLYSRLIFLSRINPSNDALNNVTSDVDNVIAAIPSFLINSAFNINFKIIEENATKNGVFESLKE